MNKTRHQKDTTILSAIEIAKIKERSKPQVIEEHIDDERNRWNQIHEKTIKTADKWENSIANERKARITRLQREA